MGTKKSKLQIAVLDGISKGMSAKETAYHHNFDEKDVRRAAYNMRLSFPWSRLGVPPKYSAEPVPVSTLFRRHRHTAASAARKISAVVRRMGVDAKEAPELLRIVNFLKKRSFPEAWESRIKVIK